MLTADISAMKSRLKMEQYLNKDNADTLIALLRTLELKDSYTLIHSMNVAEISYLIASEINHTYLSKEVIGIAGFLHDIGKIAVPDSILTKTRQLTAEEFQTVKLHTRNGFEILSNIKKLVQLEIPRMVLYHHERIDGFGYEGLSGTDIPIGAKIITVADSFDAMTTKRVYRNAIDYEIAVEEITNNAGKQFDEEVVAAFCKVIKQKELRKIRNVI